MSGSGKTTLSRRLIQCASDEGLYDMVFVFTGAPAEGEFDAIPRCRVIAGFDKGALATIVYHQDTLPPEKRRRIIIVFDDLLGEVGSSGDNAKLLAKTASLCRKLDISILFLQQSIHSLNKTVRLNCDSVIVTKAVAEDVPPLSKYTVGVTQRELSSLMANEAKLGRAFLFANSDAYDARIFRITF